MSTDTIETLDTPTGIREQPYVGEPGDADRFSHYVAKGRLADAIINGTPLVALCGKTWVPTRDPKRFPVCAECKDVFEQMDEGPSDPLTP